MKTVPPFTNSVGHSTASGILKATTHNNNVPNISVTDYHKALLSGIGVLQTAATTTTSTTKTKTTQLQNVFGKYRCVGDIVFQ